MAINMFFRRFWLVCAAAALATGLICTEALAQTTGYAIGEPGSGTSSAAAKQASSSPDSATAGPVRMGRFSFIQGDVTWRTDDGADWSAASINQPLRQGAQISVAAGGRAEIQFDDGSYVRLGNNASAILQLLFSDADGEFTQITLTNGLASLRLKHDKSVYQVDTPIVSVKAAGPARLRIGISDGVEVGVRQGAAVVEGAKSKVTMKGGDYLDLRDETSAFDLHDLPVADSWEKWNDERDQLLDDAERALERHQVPPDIAMVAGNLDAYGTWRTDTAYGTVWCPRTIDATWRPYFAGHWTWVSPFGWTWCSDEAWGWAPYHYGAWFHAIYGWAWRPGPANQYWCPAVVQLTEYNGSVAWCPLCPSEIQYPTAISVGLLGGDWPRYFSIGAAGSYYPISAGVYAGRAFSPVLVNQASHPAKPAVTAAPIAANTAGHAFVPLNARTAAGVTASTQAAFAGRGPFTSVLAGSTAAFVHGRSAATPAQGRASAFGPEGVTRPMHPSSSPIASVQRAATAGAAAAKSVFRSPVPEEPVKSGIAAAPDGGAFVYGAAGAKRVATGVSPSGTGSGAAAAARASVNAGIGRGGAARSSGTGTVSGYSSGPAVSGVSPAASTAIAGGSGSGHAAAGTAAPAPAAGAAPSSSGSGAGHPSGSSSGGSPAGGGSHVGGGTPSGGQTTGGSPARKP